MTELMQQAYDWYHSINYDISDPRVKDWFLMNNILYPISIISIYLFAVVKLGPWYMQNRKPFNLNKGIIIYNIIQIVSCFWLIKEMWYNGWSEGLYSLKCTQIDYSNDPRAVRFVSLGYWLFMIKLLDLVDTVFFVLRKKNEQVSFLHLYHHSSTVIMTWAACKYVSGVMVSAPAMLNSGIHVIMYSYYLLALLKIKWVTRYKKYITVLQMVQMLLFLLYTVQLFLPGCTELSSYKNLVYIYDSYVAINLYLFYDFFKNTYQKKKNYHSDKKIVEKEK